MPSQSETPPKRTLKQHALRVAPFLLLGPITGPLAAGVVLNFKDGRPVLASLYLTLLIELTVATPWIAAKLTQEAVALMGR